MQKRVKDFGIKLLYQLPKYQYLLVFLVLLTWLRSLSQRITSTARYTRWSRYTRHKDFHRGNHIGENSANFLRIVLLLRQYHKMRKPNKKKSSAAIYISFLSLSLTSCELEWVWVCLNEGVHLPIYTLQVTDLKHNWGWPLILTRLTSPRETPKAHYNILYPGLLPRLTTEVVPQGPYITMASRKEANTSSMGVQHDTMIIYIRMSFEVTITTALPLN